MKFRDLSFIGMVVVVVGGLQTLSFVNKPPAMPEDLHHTTVSRDVRAQCLQCHQAQTLLALERANRHPAKWRDARSDCLLCHIPAGGIRRKAGLLKSETRAERLVTWMREPEQPTQTTWIQVPRRDGSPVPRIRRGDIKRWRN